MSKKNQQDNKQLTLPNKTPMMQQFNEIKEKFPDSILFYRLGDFYEMFGEDAVVASKILGIALTTRNKNAENQIPMCGIPHHSHRQYMMKLIKAGYKVAICDQLEDPAEAKGIVKRGVIRVVSSGTVVDDEEISSSENNFLLALHLNSRGGYSVAATDVSTGEVYLTDTDEDRVEGVVASFDPKEILACTPMSFKNTHIQKPNSVKKASETVLTQYNVSSALNLGIEDSELLVPLDMLFNYVKDAYLDISFARPVVIAHGNKLVIDQIASDTLELHSSSEISLYSILNYTSTAMGARLLKWWILHPSRDIDEISKRQEIIEYFTKNWEIVQELEKLLSGLNDIERIVNRVASKRVGARELVRLKNSLIDLPRVADILESTGEPLISKLGVNLEKCSAIVYLIETAILEEPAQLLTDGDIIQERYNEHVDNYRTVQTNSKQMLANLEATLKTETGINQLKIGYNRVFGYFIEVSKTNLSRVPEHFERKQTLVNAERFVTDDLKELENTILNAEDKLAALEYEIFLTVRDMIAESSELLRSIARQVATLDAHLSLARAAVMRRYIKPTMTDNGVIDVTEARHPLVEANSSELFIPNNIYLDNDGRRLLLITGPNMAGKSTYIRSVALVVLMAHIGSFVPATSATISLVDRIFTRVGASDNIAKGESTFMVEMVETANILTHATDKSLIILDEIGRGTSTYDGLSIAWAVTEHLLNKVKAKTLFTTHYHELAEIAEHNQGAKNYTIAVKEHNNKIIFMRRIEEGSADKSYGIYVAELAGLPQSVTTRAKEVLASLENTETSLNAVSIRYESDTDEAKVSVNQNEKLNIDIHSAPQPNKQHKGTEIVVRPMLIFDEDHPAIERLKTLEVNALTPIDALNVLAELKKLTTEE